MSSARAPRQLLEAARSWRHHEALLGWERVGCESGFGLFSRKACGSGGAVQLYGHIRRSSRYQDLAGAPLCVPTSCEALEFPRSLGLVLATLRRAAEKVALPILHPLPRDVAAVRGDQAILHAIPRLSTTASLSIEGSERPGLKQRVATRPRRAQTHDGRSCGRRRSPSFHQIID